MSKRQAAKERAPKAALQWATKKSAQPTAQLADEDIDDDEDDSEVLEPVGVEEDAKGDEEGAEDDEGEEEEESESYSDASDEKVDLITPCAASWLTFAQEAEAPGVGPSKIPLEDYSDSSEDDVRLCVSSSILTSLRQLENRIGEVPTEWYNEYDHIGYNVDGTPIDTLTKIAPFSTLTMASCR